MTPRANKFFTFAIDQLIYIKCGFLISGSILDEPFKIFQFSFFADNQHCCRALYGPRLLGFASAASTSATMSVISNSRQVTPAAIAGLTRRFPSSRTKL